VARLAKPRYVNVFLGRLNSFVADNGLGDGTLVGERATVASQAAVREARAAHDVPTRQIGASFRGAGQIRDLAGIDVMTMPPKVAKGFLDLGLEPEKLADRTGEDYRPPIAAGADPAAARLDTLWNVEQDVVRCVDALEGEDLAAFTPVDLVDFFARHGCGDVFPRWTPEEIATSAKEGKIPRLEHWREALAGRRIGLDSLMNLAGFNSFTADQKAMDDHVAASMKKG
jgi:transaldolase